MRKEYDFSKLKARRNPHAKKRKKQITFDSIEAAGIMGEQGGSAMKTLLDAPSLSTNERLAIAEAARVLKHDLPVTRVILFGSKARGDSRPDSDIDLLVLTGEPLTRPLEREISRRLYAIELDRDVLLNSLVLGEDQWTTDLVRQMLIHSEVQRDGCEL